MQSVKIRKSVGVVFIDCKNCNPNCPLQQQVTKSPDAAIWEPFEKSTEHMIRTRNLLVGTDKIVQNTQEFYEIARKTCYNCTEKQR
jgi:hypothetical protein